MKIVYERTFPKVGMPKNFPRENCSFSNKHIAVVADGITRDSLGCPNLAVSSEEEIIRNYPNPSPASKAADYACATFSMYSGNNLRRVMEQANDNIWRLNYDLDCDYLENDYAGCVAAAARIDKNILYYSYICDCGVAVWDKDGALKFQTEDDKAKEEPFIEMALVGDRSWNVPVGRVLVRKVYRNNRTNPHSYGALTGETNAKLFIRDGHLQLEPTDTVAVYSDGFTPYFSRDDFFQNIKNMDNYVHSLENTDGMGREKTIIIARP